MNTQEIRQTFLKYFEQNGHTILPSSSVVPHADRTLLFANAGMNQFKDVFTGLAERSCPRATTVQKCIRAGGKHNDLDNVGYTARHLTFFEMLGNFSFGDYFKKDAIKFGWDLLTSGFGLEPDDLWVTVYKDDDEARSLWRDEVGLRDERILGLGKKDNYWSMGDTGPCGPCSEILLDRGEAFGCGDGCGIGKCDCDRYFELWNLVFMQFDQQSDGTKVPLAKPCIDTGMGLERLAMVLQGIDSVFETDTLRFIIKKIEELTGVPYTEGPDSTPHRVIADHIRCLVFAFADGAQPENDGRGYVLRRILRRAARYGRKLYTGEGPLLSRLVDSAIEIMSPAYPEIRKSQALIEGLIRSEEERFGRTLDQGLQEFERVVGRLGDAKSKVIAGKDAFLLYDTFGFPVDLVQQMASERSLEVDMDAYDKEMEDQRRRSRKGSRFNVGSGKGLTDALALDAYAETCFRGYEKTQCESELLGITQVDDDSLLLVLSDSPFYAESGGQIGDTGILRIGDVEFRVEDTRKEKNRWIHIGKVVEGDATSLKSGAVVQAAVDEDRRRSIERNHTATHLLHAAMRQRLGTHVHQKGSLVSPVRLRFDVTHFDPIQSDERFKIEEVVQAEIARNTPVKIFETDYDDAVRQGAMALFGEKYGDVVRVVQIGEFSVELCGGTHVDRTGDIGTFALTQEGSVSAGVRRVEAMTADEAGRHYRDTTRIIETLAGQLKTAPDQIIERVTKLQEDLKKAKSGQGKKKPAASLEAAAGIMKTETLGRGEGQFELHYGILDGQDRGGLLEVVDGLKSRVKNGAFLLMARDGDKVFIIAALTKSLVKAGWNANEVFAIAKERLAAKGGGRPDMVQGGGSNGPEAENAIEAMASLVRERAASA
jgi:alanyl-tRNA synthetase